jgi:DNA-binding MarR family transcriptional regulator
VDTSDDRTSRLHRALASAVRVGMLRLLAGPPQSVSDVARVSGISVSMATRHLALLAAAGLIDRQRNGSCVNHRITAAGAAALATWSGGTATSSGGTQGARPQERDAADLTDLLQDDVDFILSHGLGAIAAGICERDRWVERLVRDLGPEWRGRLPTVWEAAMRLFRGESLQGLPLPPGLVANPPPAPAPSAGTLAWMRQGFDP